MPNPFENHPYPWTMCHNAATCGNGSSIHVIRDAKGETVSGSLDTGFNALWTMYLSIPLEKREELGEEAARAEFVERHATDVAHAGFREEDQKTYLDALLLRLVKRHSRFDLLQIDIEWRDYLHQLGSTFHRLSPFVEEIALQGFCKECTTKMVLNSDTKVPDHDVWECPKCGHPHAKDELSALHTVSTLPPDKD